MEFVFNFFDVNFNLIRCEILRIYDKWKKVHIVINDKLVLNCRELYLLYKHAKKGLFLLLIIIDKKFSLAYRNLVDYILKRLTKLTLIKDIAYSWYKREEIVTVRQIKIDR